MSFLNWMLANIHKLAPYGTDGRLLLIAKFKVTWHKNWDKNQKSDPDKLKVLCPNLRIRGHLPAPIINGGGDSLWKCLNFRLSRARDLDVDLGSGHTAYHHASLIDLSSTYIPNFIEIEETFCGRTDGQADGHLRSTLLGRLGRPGGVNLIVAMIL